MTEKQGDWQLKCAVIKDRGDHILQTGTWSDCKFLVGRTSQKYFNAHKLILAMSSPVFEAMFYGVIAENDTIYIPEIQPETFEALLEYIYTDKIKMNSFVEASALYYCGEKYMLPYLTEGCVKYLSNTLKPANVCQTYEFAKMFDEYELMDRCLQMIQTKTSEVLNDDSFAEASHRTVEDIFCLKPLNIENELEILKAAERYAKRNAYDKVIEISLHLENIERDVNKKKENKEDQVLQSKDVDDFKSQETKKDYDANSNDREERIFRSLLNKILLLSLTPQQFAEGVAHTPYITQAEKFAILMNIASSNTDISIPKGFNLLRNPRYKLVADPANNLDLGLEKSKTRSQTVYRFTIPDFMKAKHMSLPFVVRKLSWRIAINPKPDKKSLDEDELGIFLYCDYINKALSWSCAVQAEISIISNKSNAVHLLSKVDHIFKSTDKNRGCLITTEKILDPKNGYVKNDTITIELNLRADEPIGI